MALFGGVQIPNRPDLENTRKLDLLPVSQIWNMQRVGVAINPEWFRHLTSEFSRRAQQIRKDIIQLIPADKLEAFASTGLPGGGGPEDPSADLLNPESSEQTSRLLFDLLGIGRKHNLKYTKSGNRLSTGKKQLESIKLDHPVVPKILEYRGLRKLISTYTSRLPEVAKLHPAGADCPLCGRRHWRPVWRVHSQILTTRTDTGRLANKNPNLMNIPARTPEGREVRKGFVAEEGRALIDRDYAQIELRGLADQSGDENMIRIFRQGGDIHLDTAMRAFHITDPKKVDKLLHRAPCKNVNFGIGYGLSASGLLDLMALTYSTAGQELPAWIDLNWCEQFINQWFDLYPACKRYFAEQHRRAMRYEMVWSPMGRIRRIPEVRSAHERIRQAGIRQAGNMPIQGFAADIFKLGLARTEKLYQSLREDSGIDVWALLPIHDEQLAECDEDYAELVNELAGREMDRALTDEQTGVELCRVPIVTDGKVGKVWEKD